MPWSCARPAPRSPSPTAWTRSSRSASSSARSSCASSSSSSACAATSSRAAAISSRSSARSTCSGSGWRATARCAASSRAACWRSRPPSASRSRPVRPWASSRSRTRRPCSSPWRSCGSRTARRCDSGSRSTSIRRSSRASASVGSWARSCASPSTRSRSKPPPTRSGTARSPAISWGARAASRCRRSSRPTPRRPAATTGRGARAPRTRRSAPGRPRSCASPWKSARRSPSSCPSSGAGRNSVTDSEAGTERRATRSPRRSARRARTPALLQMEAVECGAAALGIVLAYHGRIVPLPELRRECGVSRDGSNAANVIKAAQRYGLEAHGYSRDVEDLRELELPCIVFWNFNHFVVVEGFARNAVHINDPALGHRRISLSELEESFTGVVLVFRPGPEFRRGGAWPSTGRSLRRRLSGMGGALAFTVLTGFLLVLPGLSFAAFTQVFLDEILIQGQERWLRGLCLAMVAMTLIQALLKWLQLSSLRHLRLALASRGSARFFRHLLRLPVDFYAQRYAGEVSARSALETRVAGVLSGQLAQTAIDVVMLGFYAAAMFLLEARLTWFGIASAALNFFALRKLSGWRVEANMRLLQDEGKLAGLTIAGLQNIETIKASGLEAGFFRRWAGHQAKASNARTSIGITNEVLSTLPDLLGSLTNVAVLVVGSLYVIDGRLTIGSLVAFRILMGSFLRPVTSLVRLGGTLQELRGDLARLDDVLEQAA